MKSGTLPLWRCLPLWRFLPRWRFGLVWPLMGRTVAGRIGFALALCTWWLAAGLVAAAERAELLAAIGSITKDEAKTVVDMLADDSFEGRETGSRGGRAAGNFLMKEMEKRRLVPAGDGQSYFQSFNGSSRNVLGLVEGRDPALQHELVLIGAHYDHVGYGRVNNSFGPWGYIHNGADDNASGVAGVLEMIDSLQHLPQAPRRSLLFVFWDAEEQGLLGSYHWLAAPSLRGRTLAATINLDMIGRLRNSHLELYGSRTSTDLRRTVSQANRDEGLDIDFSFKMKADSDHYPFFARSIPTLMFHTGLHSDYHRPSDDAERVSAEGIARVSRVALLTALDLAERDRVGGFRRASRQEHAGIQAALEQPIAPQAPRFGIPFEVRGDPPQFVLLGTTPGSPAQRAGLRAGDRIIALGGRPVESEQHFRLALLAASGQTTFTIERPGEAAPRDIKVTPLGPPIRVGINWRTDDAEPQAVILTQVVYGSAAQAAGLAVRDRIYSVNGRSFTSDQQFGELIASEPAPLVFEVERQGRLSTATLEVLP